MIPANTSITLGAQKPKKDAVIAQPGLAAAANEVRLRAGSSVNPALTQSIVGSFHALYRYAKTHMKDLTGAPAVIKIPMAGGPVTVGAAGAADISMEVGADIHTGDKSHFMHRTFIRLVERWLEASKGGEASAAAVASAFIKRVSLNDWRAGGEAWGEDRMVTITLTLTDPDGQSEEHVIEWAPPRDMSAAEVVTAIAIGIDNLVHYSVIHNGVDFSIAPTADGNTITSNITVS